MKFKFLVIKILILVFIGCNSLQPIKIKNLERKSQQLTSNQLYHWHHKDIVDDTIVGVSLDKAYKELINHPTNDTIIVALLDNRIDLNHSEISDFIWLNKGEIPNNKIDDDDNGFIDDINGWNFLGSSDGQNVDKATLESTRIIRRYKNIFESKTEIPKHLIKKFELYKAAKKNYDSMLNVVKQRLKLIDQYDEESEYLFKKLSEIYTEKELSIEEIDNLSSNDSTIQVNIVKYRSHLKYADWRKSARSIQNSYINIFLNLNYDERKVIGDDMYDINDLNYGNGNVNARTTSSHNHAIKMAGILCADRESETNVKGITNIVKLMPVCVSPSGDEQDKDIALGIRYAVDNGAKVIIMTFTKYLVQNEEWLIEAFKYASENNVLIVLSAGNSSSNSDIKKTFPNDYLSDEKEFVNNVIVVSSIGNSLSEKLVSNFSNYGSKSVDIFAPGESVYTTKRNNSFGYESGTSISAPIVAGIAALIRSHYPNLSAVEVKQIIMESGVSYDLMVNKPTKSKEKELVPFSSLSKSGKIVNAYNALLMAEKVSKQKK